MPGTLTTFHYHKPQASSLNPTKRTGHGHVTPPASVPSTSKHKSSFPQMFLSSRHWPYQNSDTSLTSSFSFSPVVHQENSDLLVKSSVTEQLSGQESRSWVSHWVHFCVGVLCPSGIWTSIRLHCEGKIPAGPKLQLVSRWTVCLWKFTQSLPNR